MYNKGTDGRKNKLLVLGEVILEIPLRGGQDHVGETRMKGKALPSGAASQILIQENRSLLNLGS